jgi:hypothetical protein
MSRGVFTAFIAGASLAVLLGTAAWAPADPPSDKVKKFLGGKAVTLLEKATKVEVFRIRSERTGKQGDKYIAGYAITAKGKEQGKELAAKVRKAMFEDKTYLGQSARCFEPGVALRVWNDKEALEIVICFKCTNFQVTFKGEKDDVEPALFGFGPGLEPFLALAKEALPDDAAIQGLKSR